MSAGGRWDRVDESEIREKALNAPRQRQRRHAVGRWRSSVVIGYLINSNKFNLPRHLTYKQTVNILLGSRILLLK